MKVHNRQQGVGLVEIVIGTAIISLSLVGVISAFNLFVRSGLATTTSVQGTFLLEEGVEAMRAIRDRSFTEFSNLSVATTYYLVFGGNGWEATTTASLIDETFTRTVTLEEVYRRDSDDDIIPATSTEAKTLDSDTKKVLVSVSWGSTNQTHVSYEEGTTDGNLASFPSNNAGDGDAVQSFTTPAESVDVDTVDLFLKRVGGTNPSDIFLTVRSTSAVGAVLATSSVISAGSLSGSLSWVAFSFPSTVPLSPGTEYFLRLESTPASTEAFSGSVGTVHWGYLQTGSSPYAGGVARRFVGRQGNSADEGQALTQYDFSFRVKQTGSGNSVQAVTYLSNLFE